MVTKTFEEGSIRHEDIMFAFSLCKAYVTLDEVDASYTYYLNVATDESSLQISFSPIAGKEVGIDFTGVVQSFFTSRATRAITVTLALYRTNKVYAQSSFTALWACLPYGKRLGSMGTFASGVEARRRYEVSSVYPSVVTLLGIGGGQYGCYSGGKYISTLASIGTIDDGFHAKGSVVYDVEAPKAYSEPCDGNLLSNPHILASAYSNSGTIIEDAYEGENAVYGKSSSNGSDVWLFFEDLTAKTTAGEIYTMSFYAKGTRLFFCFGDIFAYGNVTYRKDGVEVESYGFGGGSGDYYIDLDSDWHRYEFTFVRSWYVPRGGGLCLLMRGEGCEAYVAMPRVEAGSSALPWHYKLDADKIELRKGYTLNTANLLTNPTFDDDADGWKCDGDVVSNSHGGFNCIKDVWEGDLRDNTEANVIALEKGTINYGLEADREKGYTFRLRGVVTFTGGDVFKYLRIYLYCIDTDGSWKDVQVRNYAASDTEQMLHIDMALTVSSDDYTKVGWTVYKAVDDVTEKTWASDGSITIQHLHIEQTDNYDDVKLQEVTDKLDTNKWYTLSFWCRGRGTLVHFLYPSAVSTNSTMSINGDETAGLEDGAVYLNLTDEWKLYKIVRYTSAKKAAHWYMLWRMVAGYGSWCEFAEPVLVEGKTSAPFVTDYDEKIVLNISGRQKGVYLRWIDGNGCTVQYLFKHNKTEHKTTAGSSIYEEKEGFGYRKRNMGNSSAETINCGADFLDADLFDTVRSVGTSPVVDMYLGKTADGTELWKAVTVDASTYTKDDKVHGIAYGVDLKVSSEETSYQTL